MSSPNSNDAQMKAWLAKANAAHFGTNCDFGNFGEDGDQGNPTDHAISGAGRDVSSDGSLDSNS